MKTIFKYQVYVLEPTEVELPIGSQIIKFENQGTGLYFWAIVDPDTTMKEKRTFLVLPTGYEIPYDANYISTTVIQAATVYPGSMSFVWHLFEKR